MSWNDYSASTTSATYYVTVTVSATTSGGAYWAPSNSSDYRWDPNGVRRLDQERQRDARLSLGITSEDWPAAKEAAEDRARMLLIRHLNPSQRTQFEAQECFEAMAPSGRRYRIQKGQYRNVWEIDGAGEVDWQFCAHPVEWAPDYDVMLAQKLLIETDEARFLRVANRTRDAFWM